MTGTPPLTREEWLALIQALKYTNYGRIEEIPALLQEHARCQEQDR